MAEWSAVADPKLINSLRVVHPSGLSIECVRSRTDGDIRDVIYRLRTPKEELDFCVEESGDPTEIDPKTATFFWGEPLAGSRPAAELRDLIVAGVKHEVEAVSSGRRSYERTSIVIR